MKYKKKVMMDTYIKEFPLQLKDAIEVGSKIQLSAIESPIENVLLIGMGGSGIGGDFIVDLVREELKIPYLVNKGYTLPKFVDKNTLVICSSYSGNTEETISGFNQALEVGARVLCITSGGTLLERAEALNLDYVQIPNNGAPPRACLGYSMVAQLYVLYKLGLISNRLLNELEQSITLLESEQEDIIIKAKELSTILENQHILLYGTERIESLLIRLRQQLNENSKLLCGHHTIPEMNHNELVGWRSQKGDFTTLFFRLSNEYYKNAKRIEITKEVMQKVANHVLEVNCKGSSLLEQMIYGVHLGDWLSWELSLWRNVDASEIDVINYLKKELAKVDTKSELSH